MAYTEAVVKRVEPNQDGSQRVLLVFVGDAGEAPIPDTLTVAVSAVPDADYLRRYALARLTTLNATMVFKGLITPGMVLDTTTPLPVPTDTQEQRERLTFLTARATYYATKEALALGLVSQASVDTALALVQRAWKPEYLGMLRSA